VTEARAIEPIGRPVDADVVVPGSKSLTNRALVLASLAEGTSTLRGALVADDTEAMAAAMSALGAAIELAPDLCTVTGFAGRPRTGPLTVDARLSGTTARFVLPVLTLGDGPYVLDGEEPLRDRPMGPTIEALRRLGAEVDDSDRAGHLPVVVRASGFRGDGVTVEGGTSSQFTSGLLLVGAVLPVGVSVDLAGPVVSRPYIDMTIAVLRSFGVDAGVEGDRRVWVRPGGLRATDYAIEPDASAASYFFAAAAICGGRVRVRGLGSSSLQGDVQIVRVLERMGATVDQTESWTEVRGTGVLHGVDVDLTDMPDMAQTIAALAPFADTTTRVRGVEVIRGHETDRIAAVVAELRRCGIDAEENPDGFTIRPGTPGPARIETYRDHRMAMSFALLGLRVPGIEILDPACVSKTFPDYFASLEALRVPAGPADR
jgi:3-phosphoshikimate 1-carboxyvinyltransferase